MIQIAAVNPNLLGFVLLGLTIVILGVILRYFRQPYVIAYILAGVLVGKHGLAIVTDVELISSMGEIGLIMLLFFIGMEISLPNLVKNWKIATIGTTAQVFVSTLLVGLIGHYLQWSISQIIVLGFVISLSSSAVVIKLLQDKNETQTQVGRNVISILLMQDILIVPMLILTNYLGGNAPSTHEMLLQTVGGIFIIGLIIWIWKKETIVLPFSKYVRNDHEIQIFAAFFICFGCALLTAFFGLSAALGAFVGGIIIHAARSTQWFHESLHSFQVLFVALFFVSIGMLIDLHFLVEHWKTISLIIISLYITNHFINALILHYFGRNWKNSHNGGALLAQVGELSFVLAASAFQSQIINNYAYQLTIVIISISLLLSPFWISIVKRWTGRSEIK